MEWRTILILIVSVNAYVLIGGVIFQYIEGTPMDKEEIHNITLANITAKFTGRYQNFIIKFPATFSITKYTIHPTLISSIYYE